jgi:hypothetical protein
MSIAELPPAVEIDSETKKAVIGGLKSVIATFTESGLLDPDTSYQLLLSHPDQLYKFIQTFKANRELVDEVVKAPSGTEPVRDDDMLLICGVSLNQIQQLLVRTCARKAFELDRAMETVTETKTKKIFGIFTKKISYEVQRPSNDPVEARKARDISKYMAFDWQLPLIDSLRKKLNSHQIMEIGDSLLALKSVKNIEEIARFDGGVIKKAKAACGADFNDVIANKPKAIGGIAIWNQDMYDFYRNLLGEHSWQFFAREPEFFNIVVALDKYAAKTLSYILCYISLDNLAELQRLKSDKLEVIVTSLSTAFGDDLPKLMANDLFGKEYLRKMVDSLMHMEAEKDKLLVSFGITCKSMAPEVHQWLAKQK